MESSTGRSKRTKKPILKGFKTIVHIGQKKEYAECDILRIKLDTNFNYFEVTSITNWIYILRVSEKAVSRNIYLKTAKKLGKVKKV